MPNHKNKVINTKDQNRKGKERQQGTPKKPLPTYFVAILLGANPNFFGLYLVSAAMAHHGTEPQEGHGPLQDKWSQKTELSTGEKTSHHVMLHALTVQTT